MAPLRKVMHARVPQLARGLTRVVTKLRNRPDRVDAQQALDHQLASMRHRIQLLADDVVQLEEVAREDRRLLRERDDIITRLATDLDRLRHQSNETRSGLQEQRGLSLRIAQLTELVFESLSGTDPAQLDAGNTQRR